MIVFPRTTLVGKPVPKNAFCCNMEVKGTVSSPAAHIVASALRPAAL